MKRKITLREIAAIAKVSPATASIVLNDKKNQGISEKTWKGVKKIANKFNYSGNNKRRRLDKRKFIFFMEEFSYNENVASKLLEGFNDFDLKNHQFVFLFNQLINNKNNINKAIEEFRACFREWDKNDKLGIASLFNTLGFTYYQLKEYEIAVYYYKIALTVTPDYVTSLTNLAYLYQSQNQIDDLQIVYKQLVRLNPENKKTLEINEYLSRRLKNSE